MMISKNLRMSNYDVEEDKKQKIMTTQSFRDITIEDWDLENQLFEEETNQLIYDILCSKQEGAIYLEHIKGCEL